MRLSYTDFKNKNSQKDNYKFYVFAYFFIDVVVNILISLFIRLHNLYFLKNTLRKILETDNNNNNNKQYEPMFF